MFIPRNLIHLLAIEQPSQGFKDWIRLFCLSYRRSCTSILSILPVRGTPLPDFLSYIHVHVHYHRLSHIRSKVILCQFASYLAALLVAPGSIRSYLSACSTSFTDCERPPGSIHVTHAKAPVCVEMDTKILTDHIGWLHLS